MKSKNNCESSSSLLSMGISRYKASFCLAVMGARVDEIKKVDITKKELNLSKIKFGTNPNQPLLGLIGIKC